jgi:NTP pyrophosphatase (non-canonical NTP hydrolase)
MFYIMNEDKFSRVIQMLREFNSDRDWEQFHNPKDLAIALNIESSELLELFLWKTHEGADLTRVKEELADIFCFAFLLADKYQFDVSSIMEEKIKSNALKYPIDKSRSSSKKYNEL